MYKSKVIGIDYATKSNGNVEIRLEVPKGYHTNELTKARETADYVEIKKYQKRRSLDANAALWKMLTLLAEKQRTTKDELYEFYLRQYGVSRIIGIAPEAVDDMKRLSGAKFFEVKGERDMGGKTMVYLEMIFGSSGYSVKEMSRLLDHVIEDAKEQGIEFISSEERDLLLEKWEAKE